MRPTIVVFVDERDVVVQQGRDKADERLVFEPTRNPFQSRPEVRTEQSITCKDSSTKARESRPGFARR